MGMAGFLNHACLPHRHGHICLYAKMCLLLVNGRLLHTTVRFLRLGRYLCFFFSSSPCGDCLCFLMFRTDVSHQFQTDFLSVIQSLRDLMALNLGGANMMRNRRPVHLHAHQHFGRHLSSSSFTFSTLCQVLPLCYVEVKQ